MNAEPDLHWHRPDPGHLVTASNGVELSTCSECGQHLCRQLTGPAGRLSLPIPRDWDAAHTEALAEMRAQVSAGRADVDAVTAAIAALWRKHPTLPAPHSAAVHVNVSTRAELDALAGDCGLPPPKPARHYQGAQFYVELGAVHAIVAWVDES